MNTLPDDLCETPRHAGVLCADAKIDIPAGWAVLLDALLAKLATLPAKWDARVDHVGVEYGALVVRGSGLTDAHQAEILAAGWQAAQTCDVCGAPGEHITEPGRERTRCRAHMLTKQDLRRFHAPMLTCPWLSIRPGWFALVDELLTELAGIASAACVAPPRVVEVKEKWGELRVVAFLNADGLDPEVQAQVSEAITAACKRAAARSAGICDVCGVPGELVGQAWWRTRCGAHRNDR